MEIKPNEVEEVKVIGKLHGDEVKVIKTLGGFHVALGKKDKNSKKADALAAGSHGALVSYQIEKMYGSDFEPAIFKSEAEQLPKVEDKTAQLPDMMKSAGIEMYVVSKFNNLDFIMVKNGIELAKCETESRGSDLVIKRQVQRDSISPNKTLAQMFASVFEAKMKELNLKKVKNETK